MTWQTDLYDAMLQDVLDLTKRFDMTEEAAIAMRAATTNAHLTDIYIRDVTTTPVQLPNGSNQFALNVSTILPNCRGVQTVRPMDVNGNVIELNKQYEIEVVEMGDIYDPEYGSLRNNIAYMSGDSFIIRSPVTSYGVIIDWVRAPKTRRDSYDSWIAQIAPTIIILWAAAIMSGTNGDDDKAKGWLAQIEKFYIPQLKSNFLLGAAR